jgi:hypothetical protein
LCYKFAGNTVWNTGGTLSAYWKKSRWHRLGCYSHHKNHWDTLH